MKILLADDHFALRQGVKQILSRAFPDADFGEAESTPETLEAIRRETWDILLLDINMPGRGGLEVIEDAHRNFPTLPILVFTCGSEKQLAVRVLKAGASGFLSKHCATGELVEAVQKVAASGRYVSPSVAEYLAAEISRPDKPPQESLSNREFEILQLMVTGLTIKEIASDLSLSPKTVSTFRCRIFEKLGVRTDMELANYVHRHQLFAFEMPDA